MLGYEIESYQGYLISCLSSFAGLARLGELWGAYKSLSKARLSLLVVSTAAAGYVAGSPEQVDWAGMGWTCIGTMAASSSASALNQVCNVQAQAFIAGQHQL